MPSSDVGNIPEEMSDKVSEPPILHPAPPPAVTIGSAIAQLRLRPIAIGLAIVAIALAGAIFLLLVTTTEGEEAYLREKMAAVYPHIVLTPERITPATPRSLIDSKEEFVELAVNRPPIERRELKPYLEMMARVQNSSPVVTAVAPFVSLEGVLRNGVRSQTASVRGIDPGRESAIAGIARSMEWGGFDRLASVGNGVVIGRGISSRLLVTMGDRIRLVTATGRVEDLVVVGVFRTGVDDLDDRRAFITLEQAQTLKDMSRIAVTGMSVQLSSVSRSTEVRQRIEAATGYRATTIEEINLRPLSFHRRNAVALQLLVCMLLLVAGFGAANALQGVVLTERRRASGVSVSRRDVGRLLMRQGFLIGLAGGALAVGIGALLVALLGDSIAGIGLFPRNNPLLGFHPERFIVTLDPIVAGVTFGVALIVAMAAAMLTAARLPSDRQKAVASNDERSGDEVAVGRAGSSMIRRATRGLRENPLQAASMISAIAFSVMLMLVSLSLFDGLLDTFRERVLDVAPHLTMTPREARRGHDEVLVTTQDGATGAVELVRRAQRGDRPRVRNGIALLRVIERTMGSDIRALSPFLSTQALAGFGTTEATLELHGVYPDREAMISDLKGAIVSGSIERLQSNRSGVLLGDRAAKALGASTGSRLRLVSMTGEKFNAQVVGIYSTGVDVVDRRGVVNLRLAQALEHALPGEVSGVGMQLGDPADAPVVSSRVERLSGRQTESWDETHAPTLANFRYLRDLFLGITALLMLVSALGLTNNVMRAVADSRNEKERGIASRGRSWQIARALLIAGAGSIAGVLLGSIAVPLLALLPGLSPDSGVVSFQTARLPVVLHLWHIAAAFGISMLLCTIAVLPPILRGGFGPIDSRESR